ncbi:hypothetical protein GUITHDRAFT_149659, partial [Guillardia theta CCMP2712]
MTFSSWLLQVPVEDLASGPGVSKLPPQLAQEQAAMPTGKYYLMKMIRRQVEWKRRQKQHKEDAAASQVHMLRSYKQIMADKLARMKAISHAKLLAKKHGDQVAPDQLLLKAKQLQAKSRMMSKKQVGPTQLLQLTPELYEEAARSYQQVGETVYRMPPPNYQYTPLQPVAAAPQYQVASSTPMYPMQPNAQDIDPMAPSFVVPPTPGGSFSSPCRAEFTVQALGLHQHDSITITLLNGPQGSSISTPITSNPGSTIFTWEPSPQALQLGSSTQQACFQAKDRTGLTRNKCISVTVTGGQGCFQ